MRVPGANIHVRPSRTQLRELLGCRQTTNVAINFYPPFPLFCGVLPASFPNRSALMEILTFDSEAAALRYEQLSGGSRGSLSNYNALTKSHHFGWMPLLQI